MTGKKSKTSKSQQKVPVAHEWLLNILEELKAGNISTGEALKKISILPYEEIGYAKIDHHRSLRKGFPEVIFGYGKTAEQIASIAEHMVSHSKLLLVTHAGEEAFNATREYISDAQYNPVSRTIIVNRANRRPTHPGIAVVCGGTADLPVAEEAVVTAEIMGNKVDKVYDVGVAGIHRLFDKIDILRRSRVLVVVAGMEGALPSVIGGLVSAPIIAVPTSVGYGSGLNGIAALLSMLNSCAPGISVVNIDNGFGAGYMAGLINTSEGRK